MRRTRSLLLLNLLVLTLLAPARGQVVAPAAGPTTRDTYQNPLDVIIADPFILKHGETYYLYGTTKAHLGLEVFSSQNLVDWTRRGWAVHRSKQSWSKGNYWAPECFEHKGKFYLHYTANSAKTTLRICLAVADTPVGPFREIKTPWLDPGQAAIDSDVFRDDDGQLYLYYVLDCSENKVSEIRVCKLSDDLVPAKESYFCAKPSQKWEGSVWNEGPFVLKHGGVYYLMYSANCFIDKWYGVGVATAKSPLGPWTKYEGNPVLRRTDAVAGPGHHCVTVSPDGKEMWVMYHTLQNPGVNSARQLAADRMRFVASPDGGPDVIRVDGPTSSGQPMPSGSRPLVRGRSDEFAEATLDRSTWTVFGEEPSTWSLKGGHLLIRSEDGDVAEMRDDLRNLFLQHAPAGDFDVMTHVAIAPVANYQQAFLCLWQDHDNFVKLGSVFSDRPRLEIGTEKQGRYQSQLFDNTLGDDLYLRIVRRGELYTFMASKSERGPWTTLAQDTPASLSNLRIGIGACSPGTKQSVTASFDFLRFAPMIPPASR